MLRTPWTAAVLGLGLSLMLAGPRGAADEPGAAPRAFVDGIGPGWRTLGADDFANVNCDPDTWTWKDGVAHCTGRPVGVTRTKKPVTNFELVAQWRHLKSGGNSGIFVWASEKALTGLKPNSLPPGGIEVQVLDHGYAEQYQKQTGKKPDWFTTNGDVFPVRFIADEAVPPGLARWLTELPFEEPLQGGRRMEPLLRARNQRRDSALGQR